MERWLGVRIVRRAGPAGELVRFPLRCISSYCYGRGRGVGRGLGVGVTLGATVGVGVGVALGVDVGVAVGVGVGVGAAGTIAYA